MMMNTAPIFAKIDKTNFYRTLNKRVNDYFKEKNIKKTGNWMLHFKTIVMFSLFLAPYFFLVGMEMPIWAYLLLNIVIGIGMAGVGMNVMHDGNHGSYSNKNWINKLMGGSIYILAGNVYNWQVQHNVLHHTYTNIEGHDEDLEAGRILRFSDKAPWYKFHKFQHYYSVFLYGLLTFNWAITTDFLQMKRYLRRKLSYGKFVKPSVRWTTLVITKIIYFSIWIVIPMVVGVSWWKVVLGFVVMHYTAGLILSVIFQLAHIVEDIHYPQPNDNGEMENAWAVHQLFTTANFAPKNWLMNFYTGGLNHQIEHHIFPHISHIHYGKIAKIVKETAIEFNLPYYEFKTTRAAILSHFKHLKELGKKPQLA
jgi:linoleoyl-CoA desaturase